MSNVMGMHTRAQVYMKGLLDGTTITLRLLLGSAEGHDAEDRMCPQPLPPEVRQWAEQALLAASMKDIEEEVQDVLKRID